MLPTKERVHESTKLPKGQLVIVQRQHLRPRSTFRPSEVWSRHTAYKTDGGSAMPQSKERQRCTSGQLKTSERKRPNQWPLAATIIACESERYSITVATKTFKTVDQHGYGSPGYYGGMMPSMQTTSRTIKCEIARRTSMGPSDSAFPSKSSMKLMKIDPCYH